MYYTVQIRLRTSEEQHQILLAYERSYLNALQDLINKMLHQANGRRFSNFQYSKDVVKSSHWMLYNIALKMAKAKSVKKQSNYHRSGTWSPQSYYITDQQLCLKYGDTFQCKEAVFPLAMNSKLRYRIQQGKQVRLDLVHDNNIWYCNILMEKNIDT